MRERAREREREIESERERAREREGVTLEIQGERVGDRMAGVVHALLS